MKLTDTELKIIKQLIEEGRSTPKLIANKLDLSEQHIRNLMSDLCRFGFLKRITRGLYEVSSSKIPEIKKAGKKAKEIYDQYVKKK